MPAKERVDAASYVPLMSSARRARQSRLEKRHAKPLKVSRSSGPPR